MSRLLIQVIISLFFLNKIRTELTYIEAEKIFDKFTADPDLTILIIASPIYKLIESRISQHTAEFPIVVSLPLDANSKMQKKDILLAEIESFLNCDDFK